jgi:hypothetical protein
MKLERIRREAATFSNVEAFAHRIREHRIIERGGRAWMERYLLTFWKHEEWAIDEN